MTKKKVNLKFISILLLTLGIVCLIVAAYYTPWVQNNRYVRAYNIERQAKKYPTDSNEYKRLKAIAEAVRKGESNYTYSPNFNPMSLPAQ